jgi:hypothetical protein
VLLRTIARIPTLPGSVPLPAYALDLELVAWLIERMGFEGGGGSAGTIQAKRMREILISPSTLAREIEVYARRLADKLDDSAAGRADARFQAMARRIRQAAPRA